MKVHGIGALWVTGLDTDMCCPQIFGWTEFSSEEFNSPVKEWPNKGFMSVSSPSRPPPDSGGVAQ
eukprot:6801345-Pyramimonas_sp.AAC.1